MKNILKFMPFILLILLLAACVEGNTTSTPTTDPGQNSGGGPQWVIFPTHTPTPEPPPLLGDERYFTPTGYYACMADATLTQAAAEYVVQGVDYLILETSTHPGYGTIFRLQVGTFMNCWLPESLGTLHENLYTYFYFPKHDHVCGGDVTYTTAALSGLTAKKDTGYRLLAAQYYDNPQLGHILMYMLMVGTGSECWIPFDNGQSVVEIGVLYWYTPEVHKNCGSDETYSAFTAGVKAFQGMKYAVKESKYHDHMLMLRLAVPGTNICWVPAEGGELASAWGQYGGGIVGAYVIGSGQNNIATFTPTATPTMTVTATPTNTKTVIYVYPTDTEEPPPVLNCSSFTAELCRQNSSVCDFDAAGSCINKP